MKVRICKGEGFILGIPLWVHYLWVPTAEWRYFGQLLAQDWTRMFHYACFNWKGTINTRLIMMSAEFLNWYLILQQYSWFLHFYKFNFVCIMCRCMCVWILMRVHMHKKARIQPKWWSSGVLHLCVPVRACARTFIWILGFRIQVLIQQVPFPISPAYNDLELAICLNLRS